MASDVSIIGFVMSNARTFVNPNTAKSIVIMDNTTFEIFIASPLQIPGSVKNRLSDTNTLPYQFVYINSKNDH